MPKTVFISYGGATRKATIAADAVIADVVAAFGEKFPAATPTMALYVEDAASGVSYQLEDAAELSQGMKVTVKLMDGAGAPLGASGSDVEGILAANQKELVGMMSDGQPSEMLERLMVAFKYISSELDPLLAQQRIVSEACQLIGCDRATIFMEDPVTRELILHIAKGSAKIRIPAGQGIAGYVATTGESLNITDAYNDSRFAQETDAKTGYRTKTILCVPVRDSNGKTMAVLQAVNKVKGTVFTADDQMVLEKLSMLAGISLRNARLYNEALVSKQKTEALIDVITTMSSNLGLNSIIFTVTQRSPQLVTCDACTVFIVDQAHQELWSLATDTGKQFRIPLSAGIAGQVATSMAIINIADCWADDRFDPSHDKATGFRTRNMLCVPIKSPKGAVVGVLQLINKAAGPFDEYDEKVIDSFVGVAGSHIDNSQMYQHAETRASEAEKAFGTGPSKAKKAPMATMESFGEEVCVLLLYPALHHDAVLMLRAICCSQEEQEEEEDY